MTLNELIAEIYTLTNRPDLVAETSLAVRKATLKLHSLDFFYRDLQETVIGFSAEAYKQQYDISVNLPGFRAVKYVREWNATSTGKEKFLTNIDPEAIINEYGREATNIWYMAGSLLNIKSSSPIKNLALGYYRYPNITTGQYSSWIAVEQPLFIVEEAAASIFNMIGLLDARNKFERLSAENARSLLTNYLNPQAR